MAEALLRDRGADRFEAFSAGTHAGHIRDLTRRVLTAAGLPAAGLHSQSVADYLGEPFDYVITVCDDAEQECPVFPGSGRRLHWSFGDPSAATGTDAQRLEVFQRVFDAIAVQVSAFVASP
jgi:arsenate reductase